jgi:hypothetical protein
MKHRKLRIAWSVFWGVPCVFLIVLWARSYWYAESLTGHIAIFDFQVGTIPGTCIINVNTMPGKSPWTLQRIPATKWWELLERSGQPPNYSSVWGRFRHHGKGHVSVPFWFLVLVPTALGIIPWIRLRFSLGTLLITMTLVAAMLGSTVLAIRN